MVMASPLLRAFLRALAPLGRRLGFGSVPSRQPPDELSDRRSSNYCFRRKRRHHTPRWQGSSLGRGPFVSPRVADGCIARVIREPVRATPTSPAALLLP
jgi:hypothetical protein